MKIKKSKKYYTKRMAIPASFYAQSINLVEKLNMTTTKFFFSIANDTKT